MCEYCAHVHFSIHVLRDQAKRSQCEALWCVFRLVGALPSLHLLMLHLQTHTGEAG